MLERYADFGRDRTCSEREGNGRHVGRLRLVMDDIGDVIKLASGLLFYLPLPYICGSHYITLHYSTLLYITWGIFPYITLHVCALWWQVVISLSRLLCGIQPRWLCGPYHYLLCVWELLSCHFLSVRTVVTPFSILWESSMTCAVRTLCFSFMLTEQLYVCLTLHYPILYSTLWGLTLHDPILGCGYTLSLRRCGDCLICVFLILYLYNVVGGDCDPHFVFTPRKLRVTWVS